MTKISGIKIKNIAGGGVADGGAAIYFNLLFSNDQQETYVCDMALLPMLFGNLTAYAKMAEGERVRRSGRQVGTSAPYQITKVVRAGHTRDGKRAVVEFATNHGFPLQIAMSFVQAAQTIEFLQREILLAQDGELPKPS